MYNDKIDLHVFQIEIDPMGAVRMTQRGKWVKPNAIRYLNYKDNIVTQLKRQMKRETLYNAPLNIMLRFDMLMPKSWSDKKKKEMLGKPCDVKPDFDNLIKGLADAANKVVWTDDAKVTAGGFLLRYAEKGKITIWVKPDDGWDII
jgi:Holliday junction resolvase RusA-like endonuclease